MGTCPGLRAVNWLLGWHGGTSPAGAAGPKHHGHPQATLAKCDNSSKEPEHGPGSRFHSQSPLEAPWEGAEPFQEEELK